MVENKDKCILDKQSFQPLGQGEIFKQDTKSINNTLKNKMISRTI